KGGGGGGGGGGVWGGAVGGGGRGEVGAIQAVAPSFKVELSPVNVRDPAEIERAVSAFARSANGGLILTAAPLITAHRDLIIALADRPKLPAIYYDRFFANARGVNFSPACIPFPLPPPP